jgi:beta-lactamase class A
VPFGQAGGVIMRRVHTSRRTFLLGALALPLAGCAATATPTRPPAPSTKPPPQKVDAAAANARFAALEKQYGARLGVYALDTGSGASIGYRAGERFAFCSTFKTLAAAAVLTRYPLAHLETTVTITKADVDSISPVTEQHIGATMTIRELCDAAIRFSDGTAGNLLMRDIGGPAQLTAYFRTLGDRVSRLDNYEPLLNRDTPADPRDTTTPQAIAADYQRLVLGDALPGPQRALIVNWLRGSTTGGHTIKAGLPSGWTAAEKTGNGDYGRENDVGILWPPGNAKPLVLALMTDRGTGYTTPPVVALLADATRYVTSVLPPQPG